MLFFLFPFAFRLSPFAFRLSPFAFSLSRFPFPFKTSAVFYKVVIYLAFSALGESNPEVFSQSTQRSQSAILRFHYFLLLGALCVLARAILKFSRKARKGRKDSNPENFLTPQGIVGIIANMKAVLVTRFRDVSTEGDVIELVIWRLPAPVPPCDHVFKYRLAYIVEGIRVIGFDNERGKGDHCHLAGEERPYAFSGVDRLIEDFIAEVERWKNAH